MPASIALLACYVTFAAPPPRVTVNIVVEATSLKPSIAAAAIDEARAIWAPHGVDLEVPDGRRVDNHAAVTVAVRATDRVDTTLMPGTVGSITFHDGAPESTIVLYPGAASALVSAAALQRGDKDGPVALHEMGLARVLGRVLAHEIGHFLLRSSAHAHAGLMQAQQAASTLTGVDRRGFQLSRREVETLEVTLRALQLRRCFPRARRAAPLQPDRRQKSDHDPITASVRPAYSPADSPERSVPGQIDRTSAAALPACPIYADVSEKIVSRKPLGSLTSNARLFHSVS